VQLQHFYLATITAAIQCSNSHGCSPAAGGLQARRCSEGQVKVVDGKVSFAARFSQNIRRSTRAVVGNDRWRVALPSATRNLLFETVYQSRMIRRRANTCDGASEDPLIVYRARILLDSIFRCKEQRLFCLPQTETWQSLWTPINITDRMIVLEEQRPLTFTSTEQPSQQVRSVQ